VVGLLKELTTQEGCTVVMVTHDNRILELADRIVNMVDGSIKSDVVLRDAVRICEFLRTVDLFKHLTPTEITNIAEKMKRRRYAKNEIIIREGDPGEEFFLIGQGSVDVRKRMSGIEDTHLTLLSAGNFFGERALIVDEPRNATCAAASDEVEIFALGKTDFKLALETSASFRGQIETIYFQRQ
jgi:putative ABC transport system ATP-binding protein